MSDYFYWLTGDPYFIVEAKNDIVKSICDKNKYLVKDLSEVEDFSSIFSEISREDLFDQKSCIFVFNGAFPDPSKISAIINSLNKDRIFILLEEKPNKKTKFYKEYSKSISDFPLVIVDGRVDKAAQDYARKVIKRFTNWKGSNELFEAIFEYSGYSYGIVINDIKKIRILFETEKDLSFEDAKEHLFGTGKPDVNKFIDCMKNGNVKESLDLLDKMEESSTLEENAMLVMYSLMNFYKFIQACIFAKESGLSQREDIAKKAAPILLIDDWAQVSNRMYFHMDHINRLSSDNVFVCIRAITMSMSDWVDGKCSKHLIMKKLLMTICSQ